MAAGDVAMRSLMFVPGHRERMVQRALGQGEFAPGPLDVAILDLEDGVPLAEKQTAREVVAAALRRPSSGAGPARYVRINGAHRHIDADLAALAGAPFDGVVMPKVEQSVDLIALLERLDHQLAPRRVPVIVSIESARGLLQAANIAGASDRVVALLFGAEDFALDLGLPAHREGEAAELLFARSAVAVAAAASGQLAIDGIWPDIADREGLRRDALTGRRLGFAGKSCVHPDQVKTINEVFTPSPGELEHAERVVEAFEEATAKGLGAVALDGKLLDPPIVERARRIVRAAAGRK